MKKIFLNSAILLFLALPVFSQVLKPVKIDSLVTVSLPRAYHKKDTLGQQTFSANGLYGYMAVIRAVNAKNNEPLKMEEDLNKVLLDYIKGIQVQSDDGSSAQNVRDTTIGTLKAKTFTLQTDNGQGDVELRNFILLYTTGATYTFEYVYPESRGEVVKGELKAFVSSIKLSPMLQRNDQYLSNAKGMSPVIKIGLFGGGGLLIIITIILFIQKKRRLDL
ncbi:hypothetical protein [Mucilaginibacter sp.]|uniref:hypothetical protein n=1 Tax=Mucilaginibacter sp. TaxID=1882438 RepID=UPI0026162C0F|nr:hypothetical protein [Mucilaginibacter sp.]MDB4926233.1 hypothetical protein [Mucilaginibacter sp.]